MKILALNPPFIPNFSRQSRSPCVSKGGALYYPYWLAYAVGVLEKEGHEVKFIDVVADELSKEKVEKITSEFKPELIIVDTSTPSIYNDVEIAGRLKEITNAFIVLVGTHPTALPRETLNLNENIDAVAIGEYDYTLKELAEAIEGEKSLKEVKGIAYREGNIIHINEKRPLIENLDKIPWISKVYKKHLNISRYYLPANRYPMLMVLTARGCPYNCSFCNIPFKSSYRKRNVDDVIEELRFIQREMEVEEVFFEDDTFNVDENRIKELCEKIIKNNIKLTFSCNCRTSGSLELFKLMKNAGFRLFCVGFESGTQKGLNNIEKRMTREKQIEFVENTKGAGILVHGCFILGLLSDTKESTKRTIEFAKSLDIDSAQFFSPYIYPGTKLYEQAKKMGYISTENYREWLDKDGYHNTVISRPDLKAEEIVKACDDARKSFYLRPRYIASKIKQAITEPKEIKRLMRSSKILLSYIVKVDKH